jgi:hypothetical protein
MANEFEGGRSRRRYERATGPFDGLLDEPVLVYDLNLGGCFINCSRELPEGATALLKINLLDEGWITVNAETLHRLQHGYGVRFLDIDRDTASRIERTVKALKNSRPIF